jgi:hypothetical protein
MSLGADRLPPSDVVEFLHPAQPDIEARIKRIIDDYKRRFAQQAVLRTVTDVRANF